MSGKYRLKGFSERVRRIFYTYKMDNIAEKRHFKY
jgi:hypothetical protein